MNEWLIEVTEVAVTLIDWMALLIIGGGTLEAFVRVLVVVTRPDDGNYRRDLWLRYARWLVAGLTFQLAADIIETSIRSDWMAIAQIGAIALIRTFLNYFLERDLIEVGAPGQEAQA